MKYILLGIAKSLLILSDYMLMRIIAIVVVMHFLLYQVILLAENESNKVNVYMKVRNILIDCVIGLIIGLIAGQVIHVILQNI